MAKSKEFGYLSAENFNTIEGVYKGFKKNSNGVAIVLETEKALVGIGLTTVLKSSIRQALQDKLLIENETKVKLVKGDKVPNKKYFASKVFINGEEIREQTTFTADEMLELL